LALDIRLIPVLIDNAAMPLAAELPEAIAGLARRQAHRISHGRFRSEVGELLTLVENAHGQEESRVASQLLPTPVRQYIRDAINAVSASGEDVLQDDLHTVRTEDFVNAGEFYTVMAPSQNLGREFAIKIAWAEGEQPLFDQVRDAKTWMRNHGIPGLIIIRRHPTDDMVEGLQFNKNERNIQLVLWRNEQDSRGLQLAIGRVAGG